MVGYHLTLQRLSLMSGAFAWGIWVSGYDGLYRGTINKKEKEQVVEGRKYTGFLAFSKVFFHMTLSDKIETIWYPCDNKMEIQDHFRVKCPIKPLRTGFQERENQSQSSISPSPTGPEWYVFECLMLLLKLGVIGKWVFTQGCLRGKELGWVLWYMNNHT